MVSQMGARPPASPTPAVGVANSSSTMDIAAAAAAAPSPHPALADTTYTKVFVGGLAWETQRDTMRRHFQQYGDILEAVVITDKNTGRSKGYGFVTFRDADAARRACEDPNPVIDGRRANCNLAALGAHRPRASFPLHGNRSGVMSPFSTASHSGGPAFVGGPAFPHSSYYNSQHGLPNYQIYGFSPYSQDYSYQANTYNVPYGVPQYPQVFTGAPGTVANPSLYPYLHFMQPLQATGTGYTTSSPQIMQYGATLGVPTVTSLPQQCGGLVPNASSSSSSGVGSPGPSPPPVFAMPMPAIQQQFTTASVIAEQPSG